MIIILKTGSTIESIKRIYGDFEDWISEKMGLSETEYLVHPTDSYDSLPPDLNYSGIIITGSPLMVADLNLNSLWVSDWLLDKQKNGIPILGICFGHQLLSAINGGSVKNNPTGIIIGSKKTYLTDKGKDDELLGSLPPSFDTFKTHYQSVQYLPQSAEILSADSSGVIDAIRFAPKSWGVQFHPEFDSKIMKMYIESKKDNLISEGYNIDELLSNTNIKDYGEQLLKRFREITDKA